MTGAEFLALIPFVKTVCLKVGRLKKELDVGRNPNSPTSYEISKALDATLNRLSSGTLDQSCWARILETPTSSRGTALSV